ncbi:tryptophan synthase subunit beta like protein [Rhodoferax sp. 4810]|nr:tryptophan synthase subunit beta like protein [Rhodoferax jenense]
MFHVLRSPDGSIEQVSKVPLPNSELLEESDPQLRAFWGSLPTQPSFGVADAEFVRVIEDLIDVLITKNLIMHTDLPDAAQKKLMFRKGLRNRIQGALDLLDSDDRVI